MERRSGSIFIRDADQLLETGHIIEGHTHNFHHTTFFSRGKWQCQCFAKSFNNDGSPALDKDGEQLWHEVKNAIIQGGSPGCWVGIDADKKHRFELLEGPGYYACIYSHRIEDGDVTPEYYGWHDAYV